MKASRIIPLILDGEVDAAIALSQDCLDQVESPPAADVVLMEPRMQRGGHFGRLASAYEKLFSTLGMGMCVLHRQGWDGDNRPGWRGVFPVPDHAAGFGMVSTRRQLAGFTRFFEFSFDCLLQATGAGLAVFPTVRFLTIQAAVNAVEKAPGVGGAIFGVMEAGNGPDCGDAALVEHAFAAAAMRFQDSHKEFLLFAESEAIRGYLLNCGFPADRVAVNPYPAAHRFEPAERDKEHERPRHFGCLGGTRKVHNPGLLAAYLLSPSRPPGNWTVRLNVDLAAEELRREAAELRSALNDEGITLLEHRLDDTAYDRTLGSLDAMLLPYGPRYRTIGSGIFLESLCAAVIPLVPADSTMQGLYIRLGGRAPAIRQPTVEGVGDAVDDCARNIGSLLENARQVRQAWLEHEQGPLNWSRRVRAFVQHRFDGRA